jgi:hypothetical protein
MRAKVLVVFAAVALGLMLGVPSARADQITLGDSCSGTLSVSATPLSVAGSVSACQATWEYGGSSTSGYTYDVGMVFETPTTASFSISRSAQSMTGTITWTDVTFGSSSALLEGYLFVSSLDQGIFNSQYVEGGNYYFDLTLTGLKCDGEPCTGTVSSGEIPVPEPGTLSLLGMGLIGMAGYVRRKFGS